MRKVIHVIGIDFQNSFMLHSAEYAALPGGHLDLCVDGAKEDGDRFAELITKHYRKIDDINLTMDSHHPQHIASPVFWKDGKGNHPNPFTIITSAEVEAGVWMTSLPSQQRRALTYVKALEANGRYPLCIWPPHCIIGTVGHNIYQPIRAAVYEWEKAGNVGGFVTKGSNVLTEHYSAMEADVPDPTDPSTQLNMGLIQTLQNVDYLLIAGEALSHCVASTVTSIANNVSPDLVKKFVILEDATTSVKGFEHLGDAFMADMKSRGVQISDTRNFF